MFLMFFTYFSKTRPEKEGKRYLNVYEISPQQVLGPLPRETAEGQKTPSLLYFTHRLYHRLRGLSSLFEK